MSKLLKNITGNTEYSPFLFQEELQQGYTEITDMIEYHNNSTVTGKDYKYIRSKIKELYTTKGWDNCTDEERLLVSRMFIERDKSKQLTVLSLSDYKLYAKEFDLNSQECRGKRRESVRVEILGCIGANEGLALLNQDKVKKIYDLYVQGVEKFEFDGQSGLIDYFNSEEAFVGNGFAEDMTAFGYTVDPPYTVESLIFRANDILINGNY